MSFCEKCIYYEMCAERNKIMSKTIITFFPHNEDCKSFKNKADFAKVVFCKDCKYQEQCSEFIMISGKDKNIDFCSYGERRDT